MSFWSGLNQATRTFCTETAGPLLYPAKQTPFSSATFYRWYDRWSEGGPEALNDKRSKPDRVWNRIPEAIQDQIVALALDAPELSPR